MTWADRRMPCVYASMVATLMPCAAAMSSPWTMRRMAAGAAALRAAGVTPDAQTAIAPKRTCMTLSRPGLSLRQRARGQPFTQLTERRAAMADGALHVVADLAQRPAFG